MHFLPLMIATSKPTYIAFEEYSPNKPVIPFGPSRREYQLDGQRQFNALFGRRRPAGLVPEYCTGESRALSGPYQRQGARRDVEGRHRNYRKMLAKQDKRIV